MIQRKSLFRKYVLIFGILVSGSLLLSGLVGIYFSYQENKSSLHKIQREKTAAAVARIAQYLADIEQKIALTGNPKADVSALDQRRAEIELLRNNPAISEILLLDKHGKERLKISRHDADVIDSQKDYSQSLLFRDVKSGRPYRGPVQFLWQTVPTKTVSMAVGPEDAGVTVAQIDLDFLLDEISHIKFGQTGHAYVINTRGQIIAHPDLRLLLRKADFSALPQVRAALNTEEAAAHAISGLNLSGQDVLSAYGRVEQLGWLVFVEQNQSEAFAPLYTTILRTGSLLLAGLLISIIASMVLVRRIIDPIHLLQRGTSLIGAGLLDQRIVINTGDELEDLANQFNQIAMQLQKSHSDLEQNEQKISSRTAQVVKQNALIEHTKLEQQTIFDNSIVGIILARNSVVYLCNRGMEEILGYEAGELIGKPVRIIFKSDESYEQFRSISQPILAASERWISEWEFARKDGSHCVCLYHAKALDPNNFSKGVISEIQDITARKVEQAALVEVKNGLERSLSELEQQKVKVETAHRNISILSEIGREITASLNREDIMATLYRHVHQLMDATNFTIGFYRPDQEIIEFPCPINRGKRMQAYKRDMRDPNQLAVWCIKNQGEIFINNLETELHRYVPQLDVDLETSFFSTHSDALPESILYVPLFSKERVLGLICVHGYERHTYKRVHLDMLRTLAAYAAVALDNADTYQQLQSAQQQLIFQEKMASLGTLTAGVAHEINNPANFAHVGTYNLKTALAQFHRFLLDLAGEEAPAEILASLNSRVEILYDHLATITEGTTRIRDLVKDLRTFSRLDEAETKSVAIADSLRSTVNLVRMQYADSTEIKCDLSANPTLECRPAQLNQVFMNLIVNACQAIQSRQAASHEKALGLLSIRSRIEDNWLALEFEDNGGGMSQQTIAHIFEPFFTTKTVGDGMGMGLSITFGIIEKHHGTITVKSEEGVGTCFTVKLPLAG